MQIAQAVAVKPEVSESSFNEVDVIGAGVAGLVTAFELIKAGVPPWQIRILEAQDYIGGRARTIIHAGQKIDAGAYWLHNGKENIFYLWLKQEFGEALARKYHVAHFDDLFTHDELKPNWAIDRHGNPVQSFRQAGFAATKHLYEAFKLCHPDGDISLGDLAEKGDALAKDYTLLISYTWGARSPYELSANEYFEEISGDGGLQFKEGIGSIMNFLADEFRARGGIIGTNQRVNSIVAHDNILTVGYDTPHGPEVTQAAHVVLTASVGVLQKGSIDIQPPLPLEQKEAIQGLTMSELTKIVVPLSDDFVARHKHIKPNTSIDVMGKNPVSVYVCPGGNPALQILGAGPNITGADEWSLRKVQEFALSVINKVDFLRESENRIDREKIMAIGWRRNHDILGSYSTCNVHKNRPENSGVGNLTICGEGFAENREDAGTIAGAVHSAFKATRRILLAMGRPIPRNSGVSLASRRPLGSNRLQGMPQQMPHPRLQVLGRT